MGKRKNKKHRERIKTFGRLVGERKSIMYTPFFDSDGKPIEIEKIKYEDLIQLKECEEGHHIEYKERLEDGGKNQIAKEITSFSNCEGGWIFIGINDDRDIVPVDRCDYSQKIGKIVSRVSPMPEFETKFIEIPGNYEKGVLIIYVYEGRNAPYICDGSVYIRCGSNKEPVKAAERGNIEYLINRSKSHQKELDDFFRRDYYFSMNHQFPMWEIKYPFVSGPLSRFSTN